jgi:G6PDH family F420-dependent oxidoreductase
MKVGYKLFAEGYGPQELLRQAVAAERAGFDFVEVSDHFHPWLYDHGHSAFVWSLLGSIATATDRIGLATGVTCPSIRYHPAVIAQAAATVALLSEDRFTLGVGAGEQLNEHIVGRGWPSVTERHQLLREALEIIRKLWSGGYHSYDGRHLKLEDARVFDLPESPVPIVVAIGGRSGARIAADLGDGIFTTDPDPDLVGAYEDAGGSGAKYGEVPLAWAPDADAAAASAHRMFRFGLLSWKVLAELANPINFEAAAEFIDVEDVRRAFACGPDVDRHVEVAREYAEAGFDHLALVNAGPEPDGFFAFFADELAEPLRAIAPGR